MKLSIIDDFDVSDSTKKTYMSIGNKLKDIIKKTKLSNVKRIQKLINKNIPQSTSLNYYKLISKYLQHTEAKQELIDSYRKIIFDLNNTIKSKQPEKLKQLKEKFKDIDYKKSKDDFIKRIRSNDYKTDLLEFIISFYLLLPPRRTDYHDMIYIEDMNRINEKQNFLTGNIDKSKYGLVFNNFKTKNKYDTQRFVIKQKDLVNIIKNRDLKPNSAIYPKSKRTYFRDIKKITKKIFGKELGINDLRKLHSTHEFSNTKKELDRMKQDAEMMSHSVKTKLDNYII